MPLGSKPAALATDKLAGGGDLAAGAGAGYERAHGEVRVRLQGVGDLGAQGLPHAADAV
jgi:hypothetical protein